MWRIHNSIALLNAMGLHIDFLRLVLFCLYPTTHKRKKTLYKWLVFNRMFIIGHKRTKSPTRTPVSVAHTHTQTQPRTRSRGRTRRHTHEYRSRPGPPPLPLPPFCTLPPTLYTHPHFLCNKNCKVILLYPTPICYNVKKGVPPTNCF